MDTFSFMLFAAAFGLGFFAFPLAVALFTKLCAMFNSMMGDEHEPRE